MAKLANRVAIAVCVCCFAASTTYAQAKQAQCGYDRWPVKTLTDHDRSRVNFTPKNATVAALASLKIHEVAYPRDRRLEPEELTVYRVQARFLELRRESDSDFHLVITDPEQSNVRMIVEIPAPECTAGSGRETDFEKARALAVALKRGELVEVIGVGFFDFVHNPPIGARNGFELHPVLFVKR